MIMAKRWTPTVPDGAIMGDNKGGTYRVFNPPKREVGRWVRWWYECFAEWAARSLLQLEYGEMVKLPARARGRVDLMFRSPKGVMVGHSVRVVQVPPVRRYDVVASSIRRI